MKLVCVGVSSVRPVVIYFLFYKKFFFIDEREKIVERKKEVKFDQCLV